MTAPAASHPSSATQLTRSADGSIAVAAAARHAPPPSPLPPLSPLSQVVVTNMSLGVPILGSAGYQAYVYYRFNLSQSVLTAGAVSGLVIALDGDVEMCVKGGQK